MARRSRSLCRHNAASTPQRTPGRIDHAVVDDIILVDDCSTDLTRRRSRAGWAAHARPREEPRLAATRRPATPRRCASISDVVVMLHPDYQYTPKLLTAMASLIAVGRSTSCSAQVVLRRALSGGMPLYKYVANRALTAFENAITGPSCRSITPAIAPFSRGPAQPALEENSDDFVFDGQMLAQCIYFGYRIGEISCPTRYEADSSSINFQRSVVYGLGVVNTTLQFRATKLGLIRPSIFNP